ncbi:hypothetical protein G3578_17915 [Brevibacillus sp. SYP-B805]|uniref:hypothetical protein n=1 Tax=Brevibacillus sp. SYP-B805 TaxID=1578199 RepID=UPI0013ED5BA3|nr:hypothetical protein [Brevibacillus sp. SYP-B805]NGQ97042.1 hypothetical protein [Brevibacillus sp. SYP-B805]
MKVVQSGPVRTQIQKFKRFLEKAVMFPFAAKMNDRFYYKVQYWKWGRNEVVGYLIMRPDGELVPRNEAAPVLKLFEGYNVGAHKWRREVAMEKNKPVGMYKEKLEYLQALRPYYDDRMDNTLKQDMEKMIDMCRYMAGSRERISVIYEKGSQNINQMLARGYLTPEDYQTLSNLLNEVNFINYQGLRKQAATWDSVDRLAELFARQDVALDVELHKKRKRLNKLLQTYTRGKLRKMAEDSIRTYETYTPDKHAVFHSVDELIDAFDRQDEINFQKVNMPLLRNP